MPETFSGSRRRGIAGRFGRTTRIPPKEYYKGLGDNEMVFAGAPGSYYIGHETGKSTTGSSTSSVNAKDYQKVPSPNTILATSKDSRKRRRQKFTGYQQQDVGIQSKVEPSIHERQLPHIGTASRTHLSETTSYNRSEHHTPEVKDDSTCPVRQKRKNRLLAQIASYNNPGATEVLPLKPRRCKKICPYQYTTRRSRIHKVPRRSHSMNGQSINDSQSSLHASICSLESNASTLTHETVAVLPSSPAFSTTTKGVARPRLRRRRSSSSAARRIAVGAATENAPSIDCRRRQSWNSIADDDRASLW